MSAATALGDMLSPLSFAAIKRHRATFKMLAQGAVGSEEEAMDAYIAVIHDSVKRQHPEFPLEQLEELIDWDNALHLFNQVMVLSFPKQEGETRVGSPSGSSTGTPASQISAASSAGPGTT